MILNQTQLPRGWKIELSPIFLDYQTSKLEYLWDSKENRNDTRYPRTWPKTPIWYLWRVPRREDLTKISLRFITAMCGKVEVEQLRFCYRSRQHRAKGPRMKVRGHL